jgi:hypothetical protein
MADAGRDLASRAAKAKLCAISMAAKPRDDRACRADLGKIAQLDRDYSCQILDSRSQANVGPLA